MPDFTTHFLFGSLVRNSLPGEIQEVIEQHPQAFLWGLQGPDLLFYSRVYRDTGKLARFGSLLHHYDTERLFSMACSFLLNQADESDRRCLCSYFYGFLCHYALDSVIHPYVYYSILRMDGEINSSRHIQIESEIGRLMYRRLTGNPISCFRITHYYEKEGGFVSPISAFYLNLFNQMTGKTAGEKEISSGFSLCIAVNRMTELLSNPDLTSKAKSAVVRGARAVLKITGPIGSFLKRDGVSCDMLNLSHKRWFNLNNADLSYQASIPDLFETAVYKALTLSNHFLKIQKAGVYEPFGVRVSFDNGKPKDRPMRVRKPV